MRNLSVYMEDAFDFYKKVVDSKNTTKKDPNYKSRLALMLNTIEEYYRDYDSEFKNDSLPSLIAASHTLEEREDLLSLYSYGSNIMQKLKIRLTTTDFNRVINACQNCTIGEVNSFDHVVPKEEFAEFTVHPKNLFPSCSRCNGHKSNVWKKDSVRLFLNLYLDKLPDVQYLFVDVVVSGKDIETNFTINNSSGVEAELYGRIDYHYSKLQLCQRFSDNNDLSITPLKNLISANIKKLGREDVIETAANLAEKNRIAFGFNYWQSLLELELLKSKDFIDLCEAEATV